MSQTTVSPLDFPTLTPLPSLMTLSGRGCGIAACPTLRLLAASVWTDNSIRVFALPAPDTNPGASHVASEGSGLPLVRTIGGLASPPPMEFRFGVESGMMTFAGTAAARRLFVTDFGRSCVHIVDVKRCLHGGYVAAPGSLPGPRGVASRGSLTAVSAWEHGGGVHGVHLFLGSGHNWAPLRVLTGAHGGTHLHEPCGVRFSADGTQLAVASDRGGVSLFRSPDGALLQHVPESGAGSNPVGLEACGSGWLVACQLSDVVLYVGGGKRGSLGCSGSADGAFSAPVDLALVPGLGLVVREAGNGGRLQVFACRDAVDMASMSPVRVAWMAAVARATLLF